MKGTPSKPNLPIVSVAMNDEDVIARVAEMFGVRYHAKKDKRPRYRGVRYGVRTSGFPAVEVMAAVRSFMGNRRLLQIETALASFRKRGGVLDAERVGEIKRRLRAGEVQSALAREYGVSRSTIGNISAGISWVHVH